MDSIAAFVAVAMSRLQSSLVECIARSVPQDPRAFQGFAQSGPMALGMLRSGFDIAPLGAAIIFSSALAAQGLAEAWAGQPRRRVRQHSLRPRG